MAWLARAAAKAADWKQDQKIPFRSIIKRQLHEVDVLKDLLSCVDKNLLRICG